MTTKGTPIVKIRRVFYEALYASLPTVNVDVEDLGFAADTGRFYRWSGSAWQPVTTFNNIYLGSFTNDTANGAQGVTGVGFAPDFLILYADQNNPAIAMFDGTNVISQCKIDAVDALRTADTVQPYTDVGNHIHGVLTSLDADGFTITWSNLVGTAPARTIYFLAIQI